MSRILQSRRLPGGYELFVFDSGHSGTKYSWVDVELSSREWIAFHGRMKLDARIDPKSKEAAALLLNQMLDSSQSSKVLTDDQKDFLVSIEAIKLRSWADSPVD